MGEVLPIGLPSIPTWRFVMNYSISTISGYWKNGKTDFAFLKPGFGS